MTARSVQMRMRNPTGQRTVRVNLSPDEAFARVTRVAAGVPRPFAEGDEWILPGGGRTVTRCHVIEADAAARTLVYRCKPDRDDPSFTIWTWHVEPDADEGGSRVTLGWELRPVAFVRKHLLVHVDAWRVQRREAPAALATMSS